MLAGISAQLAAKVGGALALVAIVWLCYLWAYHRGVESVTPRLVAAQADAKVVAAANVSNETTINALQAQNDACVASVAANEVAAQKAAESLQKAQQQAKETSSKLSALRQSIYSQSTSAKAWGVEVVPHEIARQLFD